MSDGAGDQASAEESGPPGASDFDEGFTAAQMSSGLRRVWRAAGEALRILRRGGRLVLTDWQPRTPGDDRLSPRRRALDWTRLLRDARFVDIVVEARPEWHETFTRVYRTALEIGDPHDDSALAALQDEARRRLPDADLVSRVVVTAHRP